MFKLDTGAEVSAVTQATCQTLGIRLSEPQKVLYVHSQTPLKVVGQFQGRLECKGKETIQSVCSSSLFETKPTWVTSH